MSFTNTIVWGMSLKYITVWGMSFTNIIVWGRSFTNTIVRGSSAALRAIFSYQGLIIDSDTSATNISINIDKLLLHSTHKYTHHGYNNIIYLGS